MRLNPGWKPVDHAGFKLGLDPKTNSLKRITSTAATTNSHHHHRTEFSGESAIMEYRKPTGFPSGGVEEFERLLSKRLSFDPSIRYVTDSMKAQSSQDYARYYYSRFPHSLNFLQS